VKGGFRFRKGGAPVVLPPPAPELHQFKGVIRCAFCEDPIRVADETWYSLGRYDANKFRWTREAHARCIEAFADQDVGEDPPKGI
jgi:hypothetical protein